MAKRQYELTTSIMDFDQMPFQIYAKDIKSARGHVKKKLRKGEKIISLKRVYW